MTGRSVLTVALLAAFASSSEAQRAADAAVAARLPLAADPRPSLAAVTRMGAASGPEARGPTSERQTSGRPAWWTPLASAVLPGAGQALLDQDRFVIYAAMEGIAWLRYVSERREGSRQRRAYRELANDVARAFFTTDPAAGTFEYYERMQNYVESGVYDMDPGTPVLEPEMDTLSYNGSLWLLARRTFWQHPDTVPPAESDAFQRATSFYGERAIRPEFRWSWRNAQLEHDVFRRTIDESNEAYRQAIGALGVVLANHVLSTVDAYVTLRLWEREPGARGLGLAATLPWPPLGRRAGPKTAR